MLRPGSLPWLLAQELRLTLRRAGLADQRGMRLLAWVAAGVVCLHVAVAVAAGQGAVPHDPAGLVGGAVWFWVIALMFVQALLLVMEALSTRGDLDLLLSSPLPPSRVLMARLLGIVVGGIGPWLLLVMPVADVMAARGATAWLKLYPALLCMGLLASAAALVAALGLFAVVGPRRALAAARIAGGLTGASLYLSNQAGLGGALGTMRQVLDDFVGATIGRVLLGPPLGVLATLVAAAVVLALVAAVLGRRFAVDVARVAGVDATGKAARDHAIRGGLRRTVMAKEWRLLRRDPGLLSQIVFEMVYFMPLTLPLLYGPWTRSRGIAAVAVLTFTAGMLVAGMAWITVFGEDAPDLLRSAPAAARLVSGAKQAAAVILVAVLFLGLVAALGWVDPVAALGAALGCAVAGWTGLLVCKATGRSGLRSGYARRRQGSWTGTVALYAPCGLVAALAAGGLALAELWL